MSTTEGPESAGRGMSPHSELPWSWNGRVSGNGLCHINSHTRTIVQVWDFPEAAANADLIVRAVNNHDALLASLKEMHAFAAACMRVVVKPEHAACAAALDAEVAAAGIAEGFGIRAQEAIEKATVTHG
jgi:hypothetical protein